MTLVHAFIASTAFPIAKIAKVKRYIKVLGGLKEAARAIKLAGGIAAARQARGVLRDLVIEIGGFALIESNCL
ncbi:MAG: hypothetical protein LBF82_01995 [Lactobacillales bacterium]|nr:hypothetical protein [Lactobacillales bacterium]